ncbi:innexin inx2 [Eurytemora carolleeae]|uniref:innexin inx2 n=1 Tax=Eurytemora carolleeae TaxID=1294199 RepID=UPI000C788963|nr:innexin inx2 [Eurytemora carolleeae]|eukprot:XP_023336670.1 innexin inx2-like [Eurytemora affinis]
MINIRIYRYLKRSTKKDNIQNYIEKCALGDWFVLYQLSKNFHRTFFVDFVTELSFLDEDTEEEKDIDDAVSLLIRPSYSAQVSEDSPDASK